MERKESETLLSATERTIDETRIDQRFMAADIKRMHRLWLGEIYTWAGEYRQVNMSKGVFMFVAAAQVPKLMLEFERGPLTDYTPCRFDNAREQATALAVVHAELIVIHPFREGNGRCCRLLSILTGLQAGLPALDFGGIRGAKKKDYIASVHAALGHDYEPMTQVFEGVITRTLRLVAKSSSGLYD
jgi:cell filamentation protein